MRNQRGITLIALVITIIVLLILAGVSIAMLTGDNGILTKSNQAKEETIMGEAADKINLAINAEYANILAGDQMSGATDSAIATVEEVQKVNGLGTDFTVIPGDSMTSATVLTIKPSSTGAYKEYAKDRNLVGTIIYDTTNGYKIEKAEVVYPIEEEE